jgi:hypothetical protein
MHTSETPAVRNIFFSKKVPWIIIKMFSIYEETTIKATTKIILIGGDI